jgi:RHS repeat-associated protein
VGVPLSDAYDVLGRRLTLDDPDQGQWEYLYNAFGEMTDQEDSGGGLTHIDFDVLGRMTGRRDYTSGMTMESDTRWTYGTSPSAYNVGQVIQEQDFVSNYIKVYAYDSMSRIQQTITSLGVNGVDGDYPEYQTYDQYGRKFQTIDATAKGVQHVYNANGYLEKLVEASNTSKVYHTVTQTNARGQVTGETMMGTAFQMARGYSAQTGLATSIVATSSQYTPTPSGATLLDINLNFDAAGNLTGRTRQVKATSSLSAQTLTETFTYDQLNRLTQIAATGQSTQNLTYDASGNILTKTGVGSYGYGAGSAGPHAVTSAGGATYTYDAVGNMLTGDGRTAVYNAFRKPVSVTKGSNTTTFNYGPDRSHYKRVDTSGASITTTISVGNVEFVREGTNPVKTKRYIGGVAMITDSTVTGHEEHVLLTDHLGSTAAIAKHTALDLQQMDYDAFGKRRNLWSLDELASVEFSPLNQLTTTGFTGHEMLDGVGLIHMQGRVYDPKLGRFLSADPYVTEMTNTQNLNRYSYVYNNPLTLTDPSGFDAADGYYADWEVEYFSMISSLQLAAPWFSYSQFSFDPLAQLEQFAYAAVQMRNSSANIVVGLGESSRIASATIDTMLVPTPATEEVRPIPGGIEIIDVNRPRTHPSGESRPTIYISPPNSTTVTPSTSSVMGQAVAQDTGSDTREGGDGVLVTSTIDEATGEHTYTIRGTICSTSNPGCNADLADSVFDHVNKNDVPFSYDDSGAGKKVLIERWADATDPLPDFGHKFSNQPIEHFEYPDAWTSVNVALPGHNFYPGTVTHQVYFESGSLYYEVRGTGTGSFPSFNNRMGIDLFEPGVRNVISIFAQ